METDRIARRERDLKDAAAISEVHKHKGVPYDPAQDGFVFSQPEIDAFAQRQIRINTSRASEPCSPESNSLASCLLTRQRFNARDRTLTIAR